MADTHSSRSALQVRPEVVSVLHAIKPDTALAVVVFGSAARGDETESSDFDLLVVLKSDSERDELLRNLRSRSGSFHMPLMVTASKLIEEACRRPSFVAHLLSEGVAVQNETGWHKLSDQLRPLISDHSALRREIALRARALEPFTHAERFRYSPITARSHLYAIARSLVIARLLEEGVHEFRWSRAFDQYARLHPELRDDLEALERLRPYYDYARSRSSTPPEHEPTEDVSSLVSSVAQLAR